MSQHVAQEARDLDDSEVDDAFRAIMDGLRTTLPAVEVLFAFLLTAPLSPGFADLAVNEKAAYYVAFFASAVATVLLIAPSVHQRLRAPKSGVRRRSRRHLVFTVRMTIAGSIVAAVAIGASVYLVTALIVANVAAAVLTALVAALVAWAWVYVPLVTFEHT